MSKKRIVVTGLGSVTSFGDGVDIFWNSLLQGKSGISEVSLFDHTQFNCKVASQCKDFDATKYMDPKEVKRTDRYTHFAMAGTKLAVQDAGLDLSKIDKERMGVLIGSGVGGMLTVETQCKIFNDSGVRRVSPFMIPNFISNMASGTVAIELGAKGVNFGVVSACATATHAIGDAMLHLQAGNEDIIITGGAEAAVTPLAFAGFCAMKAMTTDSNENPQKASRPFDATRSGFVMGEGVGILVLETLEHAQARGARIYCELLGYGATCDAYHITSPDVEGRGLSLCFERVLKNANLKVEDVDYINAHGTSTPYNDKFETMAIKKVFGSHAKNLMVSSTKSMTGHLLGAAGGIEAIASIKAIQTGIVPPTINYENPDPDCDLDYVPNVARKAEVNVAISDNLGFGGHNAALLFKKFS